MLNNKISAINKIIGNEEIINIYDNNTIFETKNAEYYVLTDAEAQELYKLIQKDLIEDIGISGFTPWIQEYFINNLNKQWFDDAMEENNQWYINDIREENSYNEEFKNRLEEEISENNCSTEEEYLELLNNQYKSGVDWYLDSFGEDALLSIINDLNLLDIEKVVEYCQKIDGRGHTIASYDGKEKIIKIDNIEYYIYRIN